jgi:hypothetical protein
MTIADKEQHVARALARVDVVGEVTVVVADEMRRIRALLVPQTVVQRACDVAQDLLDGLLMLHRQLLYELADIPDSERHIWPGMNQVVQATDNTSVLRHINLLCLAVAAQLQSLLHQSVGRVASIHSS